MNSLLERLKRAAQASKEEDAAGSYTVGGSAFVCPHCAGDRFIEASADMEGADFSHTALHWPDRKAWLLICSRCGHIDWFAMRPDRTV